jgi:hypothetical protein
VRAFEIIDDRKIEGLIGMYTGAGVPDKWEVVAAFDGRYLQFTTTGTGTSTGANTVGISGTTGTSSHSHSFTGYWEPATVSSTITHSNSVSHAHSYSGTLGYHPEPYYVKFIRYIG